MAKMKISEDHYEYMKEKMEALAPNIPAMREKIIEEGRSKDPEKRLRWDIMYYTVGSRWLCDNIYPTECNDDHIDTALRRIMNEIELKPEEEYSISPGM